MRNAIRNAFRAVAAFVLLLAFLPPHAHAATFLYYMVLEGWQQVPYVVTNASGSGTATFDTDTRLLTLNLAYSNLSSSETMAHIHGPGARGVNAGILYTLAPGSPKTDSVILTPSEATELLAGNLYVNVHTTNFPNGELRAQIDNLGATVLRTLTVARNGNGSGTVTSSPSGIACGADCTETAPNGTVFTLTAAAAAGSTFAGWSGGGCAGTGTCNVTLNGDATVTATFNAGANPARLFGISTRANVLTGDNVMIGGFIIDGSTPKTVVVRARGPSLGVSGSLADPMLTLVPASGPAIVNDDWQTDVNAAQLSASGFAPGNPKEAALWITLNPGAYTVVVSGVGGTTGLAIVEVYDAP